MAHIPPMIIDNEINRACTEQSPKVPYVLTKHSETFRQGVYEVIKDRFYVAVGYGIANSTMVVGDDGIIIIDCTESVGAGTEVLRDFRKITDKPVRAIIYTHNHLDHVGGVKAFCSQEQVDNKEVIIMAHEKLMEGIANTASVVSPIINLRAYYTFGVNKEPCPEGFVSDALGPGLNLDKTTFIQPTKTFDDKLRVLVCGIRMTLHYAPSETNDEIYVWFPDFNLVQTADVLMGENYPNIHTIRGTKYRDPIKWYKSIDKIREHEPEAIIMSHGRPAVGKAFITERLTNYRDAIQYTHDQAVRFINKGFTIRNLVEAVPGLPKHLADDPWLGEHYGKFDHCIRQVYVGYLGWFQGDPTDLNQMPQVEEASKILSMMGGMDRVMQEALEVITKGDLKWALCLLNFVLTVNPDEQEARLAKAHCFRQFAYQTINTNERNWYLTSAAEMDGTLDYNAIEETDGVDSGDIVRSIPISQFLNGLCIRVIPEKTCNVHLIMGFHIHDAYPDIYAIEIRKGVAQFHNPDGEKKVPETNIGIKISDQGLRDLFMRKMSLEQGLKSGAIELWQNTTVQDLQQFFDYFDIGGKKFHPIAARVEFPKAKL